MFKTIFWGEFSIFIFGRWSRKTCNQDLTFFILFHVLFLDSPPCDCHSSHTRKFCHFSICENITSMHLQISTSPPPSLSSLFPSLRFFPLLFSLSPPLFYLVRKLIFSYICTCCFRGESPPPPFFVFLKKFCPLLLSRPT